MAEIYLAWDSHCVEAELYGVFTTTEEAAAYVKEFGGWVETRKLNPTIEERKAKIAEEAERRRVLAEESNRQKDAQTKINRALASVRDVGTKGIGSTRDIQWRVHWENGF